MPLGEGDAPACPYCHEAVPLPPAYRALRDAERGEAEGRALAASLYRRIGAPPSWWQRACARAFKWWYLVYVYPVLFIALLFPAEAMTLRANGWLHANLEDVYGSPVVEYMGLYVVATGIVVLGALAGIYGRRTGISTRGLQAALAARPPERAGGPASCRVCGAPLAVGPNDDGVRCPFCRTDNLVRVDPAWIQGVAADASALGKSIEAVLPIFERNRRNVRRALVGYGLGLGAAAWLFGYGMYGSAKSWEPKDTSLESLDWRRHVAAPERVVVERAKVPTRWSYQEKLNLFRVGHAGVLFTEKPECDERGCELVLLAALRRGERLTLTNEGSRVVGAARVGHHLLGGTRASDYSASVSDVPFDLTHPLAVDADWDAWYRIDLNFAGATPGDMLAVTVSLDSSRATTRRW